MLERYNSHDVGCRKGAHCRCMMPAARIRAFQREEDILKRAKTALGDIPSGTLFNYFHESYPTVERGVFPGNKEEAPMSDDQLSTLPTEIFDLIMMDLTPPTLDAARYVCRSWYAKIMTSTIILETVLGIPTQGLRGQSSDTERLRLLQKHLDHQSDLIRCWNHPDAWRIRYRQCDVSFLIPPLLKCSDDAKITVKSLPARQISAHFCLNGTPLGYLVTAVRAPSGILSHFMIIYKVSTVGQPDCVGSLKYDGDVGVPRIANLSEASPYGTWHFDVSTDRSTESYSIVSASAISKGGSSFTLVKAGHTVPAEASAPSRLINLYAEELEPLYTMPSTDTLIAVLPGNRDELKRSLVLAARDQIEHTDIYLRYATLGKIYTSLPLARLCPPRADVVLRNIAVSSSQDPDGITIVAVLWQEVSQLSKRPELYMYEIPKRIQVSIGDRLHPNIREGSAYMISLRQTLDYKQRGLQSNIPGKRIRSLDSHVGGVHSSSPLWRNSEEKSTRELQADLGGLAFLRTNEKAAFPVGTKAKYQAIYAWGPKSGQVHLNIFDLSYAIQNLEQLPARFYGSTDSTWCNKAAYTLHKRDPQLSENVYDGIFCQCALHDDEFNVILPNCEGQPTATGAKVMPITTWSMRYGQKVPAPAATQGCVERYESPARAKAWARRDEWLEERIGIMKRAGLDNEEVSIAWKEQFWTRKGLFDRPDMLKEIKP